jgi:hypothetical protein
MDMPWTRPADCLFDEDVFAAKHQEKEDSLLGMAIKFA